MPDPVQPGQNLQHSYIRKNWCIILSMAVAVRADILNQCNMEMRTAMTDCLCIFCHLTVKEFVCTAVWIVYCIKTAGADTTAAAFAFIIIDHCFFVYICNRITAAFFCTATGSPRQTSSLIAGFPLECCCIFPARLPQPIPMFFSAPPNPVAS